MIPLAIPLCSGEVSQAVLQLQIYLHLLSRLFNQLDRRPNHLRLLQQHQHYLRLTVACMQAFIDVRISQT
jgi:hypothetical protein